MFKKIYKGNTYIVYDDSLLSEMNEGCFNVGYWQDQNKAIGSAMGRGTTWFVQLDKLQGALRHYQRGGWLRKLITDHYIFIGKQKTRSIQEFYLLNKLHKAGVNVPKPIAARVVKRLFCYQADLLSEKVPKGIDLVNILQKRALSGFEYQKIGQQIKKMHNEQVNHIDLNIHNILLDDQGKVWIIDFDKCYQQSGDVWKKTNLDRLFRSFKKEHHKRGIKWQESDFYTLKIGYMTC